MPDTEIERIAKLSGLVEALLEMISVALCDVDRCYHELSSTDTRRAALHKLGNAVFPTHLSLLFLHEQLFDPKWWGRPGRTLYSPEVLPIILDEFERSLKSGLLMSSFSATESTLRRLATGLSSSGTGKHVAFKMVYDDLFATLKRDSHSGATLDIFRLLRNSCHNNTVHVGNTKTVVWRNRNYTFQSGTVVSFLTWEILTVLIQDVVEIITQVVLHPLVRAIPALGDPYAEESNMEFLAAERQGD